MARVVLRLHEGDSTVTSALNNLRAGADVVTVSGGLGRLGSMLKGDTLNILGHGSPTDIGGYSPSAMAKLLVDASIPSGLTIVLVACNSGTGGAPYALELKTQLVSLKNVPASVSGGTAYMQVNPDGSLKVADYDWANRQWKPDVASGKQSVNTPWGSRTRNVTPTFKT